MINHDELLITQSAQSSNPLTPTPHRSAGVLLVQHPDNPLQILSVSRRSGRSGLPGGSCEPGEVAWAAATREFHEEVGFEGAYGDLQEEPFTIWTGPVKVYAYRAVMTPALQEFLRNMRPPFINSEGRCVEFLNYKDLLDPNLADFWDYNQKLFQHYGIREH